MQSLLPCGKSCRATFVAFSLSTFFGVVAYISYSHFSVCGVCVVAHTLTVDVYGHIFSLWLMRCCIRSPLLFTLFFILNELLATYYAIIYSFNTPFQINQNPKTTCRLFFQSVTGANRPLLYLTTLQVEWAIAGVGTRTSRGTNVL
jgi:hypothetical protein